MDNVKKDVQQTIINDITKINATEEELKDILGSKTKEFRDLLD